MRIFLRPFAVLSLAVLLDTRGFSVRAAPIGIVAAENFYGDVAQQIGGPDVAVTSILANPDQDPHLFEASPSVARAIAAAKIVIANGVAYDPWMEKLAAATKSAGRRQIIVGDLVGKKPGDNPHIWYDLSIMQTFAVALAHALEAADPLHKNSYEQRLQQFRLSLQPLAATIAMLRQRAAGLAVTATEPVFGYMLDALGMQSRNQKFELAVMNNTEPGAADVAAFETDLKDRRVKFLVYNSQASDPIATRMLIIAREAHVPVVGATETEPPGKNYQAWMAAELAQVESALSQ